MGGTGRKERDGGDIEPNALNKASVMELMTGCVPLVTRTRHFSNHGRASRSSFLVTFSSRIRDDKRVSRSSPC